MSPMSFIVTKDKFRVLGRITIEKNIVTQADHELRYMKGWTEDSLRAWLKKAGMELQEALRQ